MDEYDITAAFERIEYELISSMIRNMSRHRAEETAEGIQWSMWQAEQLKAFEKYKKENQKKYSKQFKDINESIEQLILQSKEQGSMDQEIEILKAIQDGYKKYTLPERFRKMLRKYQGKNLREIFDLILKRNIDIEFAGEFFRLNQRKLDALIKATQYDMKKAETAMLRMANDQYRKIIFNAQVYTNSGAGTYEKAVDMATKDFLSRGINCIEYKNGRRVNIASYAEMAIKTANKRAYLTGEGEKRQEWGISTVIVNKRGIACPKCIRYAGRVFIDDVWSGGKASDGDYPLLSSAMAGGLYHPNCKDSHTTYFEGITSRPEPPTKEEMDSAVQKYNAEQKQKYNKRMAEKYNVLAKNSLDSDNKKIYATRADTWKQKYLSNNTRKNDIYNHN